MTNLKNILLLGTLSLGVAAAQAVPNPAQYIKLTASTSLVTTTTEGGKSVEKLSNAEGKGVLPGNVLELGQKAANVSKYNVNKIQLNMTIPAAVAYQSQKCDSASAMTQFSVDGKTFANPLTKTVTVTENGKTVTKEVNVEPSEYKFVRWTLPTIKAGETVNCAVRVKVK